MAAAVNGYELQLSTFGNLLLSSGVDLVTFQRARSDLKNSMVEIQKMMDDITPGLAALAAEKINTFRQRELIDKQISELDQMEAESPAVHDLIATARQLSDVLAQKADLVEKLDLMMQQRLENLQKVKLGFSDLADQFDATIEQRKNRDLFQRQKGVLGFGAIRQLRDEAGTLLVWAWKMVTPEFWIDRFTKIWEGAGLVAASLTLVLAGTMILLGRLRKAILKSLSGQFIEGLGQWHRIVRDLVNQSVFHGGMVLVIFLYSRLTVLFAASPFLELMANLMLVLLISRWFCTVLSGWPETFGLSAEKSASVRRFVKSTGLFACFYLVLQSMLAPGAGMLISLRMAFALVLLVWTFRLWRDVRLSQFQDKAVQEKLQADLLPGFGWKALLLTIGGVTLFLDMIGFGSLSRHWLRCWGITGAVILWWGAFFCLLREWGAFYREKSRSERDELLYDDYPVQWLMIRFGRFIWFGSLVIVMLLTWGNPQTVLTKFYQVLAHPIKVGNMEFSMLGFLYAALILLLTYIATRFWRWIFQTKFLNRSGMEVGLQDSLTTITKYVIWIFGVLFALHAFGLNTASLAVAFGALGIGLGFGLQNIFNNSLT